MYSFLNSIKCLTSACSLQNATFLEHSLQKLFRGIVWKTPGMSSPTSLSPEIQIVTVSSDSDCETIWSSLEVAPPVVDKSKKQRRRERAKEFLRKKLRESQTQLTLSPQRNKFSVTPLNPPLPVESLPELPPLPKGKCLKLDVGKSAKHGTVQSSFLKGKTRLLMESSVESGEGRSQGPSRAFSTETVQMNRLEEVRQWVDTGLGKSVREESSSKVDKRKQLKFRLLSYNVLAQNLLNDNPSLYRNMDPQYLNWEKRWEGIMQEVEQLQPDIVCLQEVQFKRPNHYLSHYSPFFGRLGYSGVYKSRTGTKEDGCAIFYKNDRFTLEDYVCVEYLQPGVSVLDRDNVGLICRLVPTRGESRRRLVVGTTHLLFNKRRKDVRLAQICLFLAELDRMSFSNGQYVPTIITGDFNSDTNSEVYDLVSQGLYYYEGLSIGHNCLSQQLLPPGFGLTDTCQWYQQVEERQQVAVFSSGSLRHNFRFKSAYRNSELERRSPSVSTFHDKWLTVDYIFYTGITSNRHGSWVEGDLKLLSRLRLPDSAEMTRIGRIPSDVCPSDHLPLVADFLLLL